MRRLSLVLLAAWLLAPAGASAQTPRLVLESPVDDAVAEPGYLTFHTAPFGEGVTGPFVRIANSPALDGRGLLAEPVGELEPPMPGSMDIGRVQADDEQPDDGRMHFSASVEPEDFGPLVRIWWQAYVRMPGGEVVSSAIGHFTYGTPAAPLTASSARRGLREAIFERTRRRPVGLVTRCRQDGDGYGCEPSWTDRKYVYAGTALISGDGDLPRVEFRGLRAKRSCIRRNSVQKCATRFRWSG